jgi:hypothetical protein
MKTKTMQRFDTFLRAMATQPEPSEKLAKDNRTSNKASGAGYGDTRTREGKRAQGGLSVAKPTRSGE